jgi:hypothetical protein
VEKRPLKTFRQANGIDARLAAYAAAAGGASLVLSSQADAEIVANTLVQPFGINGDVNIDFNHDGQTDFQIDHDRYNLNGTNLDYLQIDKNDVNGLDQNGMGDWFTADSNISFPVNGTTANDTVQAAYLYEGQQGSYPSALTMGAEIGPAELFDFQEGDNFLGHHTTIRANRLIDEDHGQMDTQILGAPTEGPFGAPGFVGLNGEIRYLGLKMDLNNQSPHDDAGNDTLYTYGWVAVRIDNEDDATGAVVGYGYETTLGAPIAAGDIGPVVANADYNDDGKVDGADLLIWQRVQSQKVIPLGSADGTGDGLVNAADLAFWKTKVGTAASVATPSTHAVPEPGSALMGVGGALLVGWFGLRQALRKARGSA